MATDIYGFDKPVPAEDEKKTFSMTYDQAVKYQEEDAERRYEWRRQAFEERFSEEKPHRYELPYTMDEIEKLNEARRVIKHWKSNTL